MAIVYPYTFGYLSEHCIVFILYCYRHPKFLTFVVMTLLAMSPKYRIRGLFFVLFYDIKLKVSCRDRPLCRPYDRNRQERDKLKKVKAMQWYTQGGYESVIFVPSTPGSVLQRRYHEEINWHGIMIGVVKKAGRSVKSML